MPFVTGPLITKSSSPTTKARPGSRQTSPLSNAKRIFHKEFDGNSGNTTIAVSVKAKSAQKRSVSSSTSPKPAAKPSGGDVRRRHESPNVKEGVPSRARSRHTVVGKPAVDAKQLTWSHTLREQTIHGIVPTRDRSPHPTCTACAPLKIEASQFINRITQLTAQERNAALSDGSTTRARSSTPSSRATNPSCNQMSEADDILFLNQNLQCKMRSSSTMKTRSSKPSSTETFHHDVDECFTSNTRFFPSCYHPITSIGFQCKELKLHVEKSSKCFTIIRGIEYNLARITAAMLDTKLTDSLDIPTPDGDGQLSIAKQMGKMRDLKMLCKSLKDDKQLVQDELDAQVERSSVWKAKEKELIELNEELRSRLEDSVKKTEEYCKALSSSAQLIAELQDENKVIPLLRTIQGKLNERNDTVVRENEMLKLDVQKMKLERESFRTLLQHKDTEIRQFKTEILEVQQAAEEQLSKMQTLNHEQRLKHLNARVHFSTQSRSEVDEMGTPKSSLMLGGGHWEGGGESALFPISSSPSSDHSNLSLGPYPSWEQISPITSDLNPVRSNEETPTRKKASLRQSDRGGETGEMRSLLEESGYEITDEISARIKASLRPADQAGDTVEEGPYEITEETMQRLEFLRLHSDSSVEPSTPVSTRERSKREPQTKSQLYAMPTVPKPVIDLLRPPSELSHWTESFDDLDMYSVSNPDFTQAKKSK